MQSILERVKPKDVNQPSTPSASQGVTKPVIPASEPVPEATVPRSPAPQDPGTQTLGKSAGAAQSGPSPSSAVGVHWTL